MSGMNRDVWLKAWTDAERTPPPDPNADAITSVEYGQLFKVNNSTARHHLQRLVRLGKAELCKKWVKRTGTGGWYPASAYRLIQESTHGENRHVGSRSLRRRGKEHGDGSRR